MLCILLQPCPVFPELRADSLVSEFSALAGVSWHLGICILKLYFMAFWAEGVVVSTEVLTVCKYVCIC